MVKNDYCGEGAQLSLKDYNPFAVTLITLGRVKQFGGNFEFNKSIDQGDTVIRVLRGWQSPVPYLYSGSKAS